MHRALAVAVFVALIAAFGLAPALAVGGPPTGSAAGSSSLRPRVSPRQANPHAHVAGRPAIGETHPRGEPPASMSSVRPKSGGASVRPDVPAHGKAPVGMAPSAGPGGTATPASAAPAGTTSATSTTTSGTTASPAVVNNANGNWENELAFTGATLLNTGCCQPPDTQMAMGNNQVLEAVNNSGLVFDRGGNLLLNFPMTNLFQPPGQSVGLTDPRVLFDPTAGTSGRFYLSMMVCDGAGCGASTWTHMGVSVAVSNSDDPTGSWSVYDYVNDGQDLQDQPKLGFSADKVTFAVNEYGCKCGSGSKFKQENVVVMQKSDLVAANSITPVVDSQNSYSSFIFDSMPTTPVNASTSDPTQYVVWNAEQSSNNKMGVVRITGTPDANNVDFSNVETPGIANTTPPPTPVQPGSCVDQNNNQIACTIAGDKTNFQSVMVQGNDLWATGTDGCTPQNDNTTRDCTRLVQVDLSGGGSSIVTDTDVGTQGTYRYNPAVMKDVFGDVFFGFTISSASQYPTAAVDASSLPLPSTLVRIDYASGDATYTGSRWGDYSGLAQDPRDDGDVWAAEEFGACAAACGSTGADWATAIGQFSFDNPHIFSVSPATGPATGGTTVDIHGADFANGVDTTTSVTFGGTAAQSVAFIDAGHIRAVSPASGSGTVDIAATTLNGSSETVGGDRFSFTPVVSSVSPDAGPVAGDQTVTIAGAGFTGTTAVDFGGTAAAGFTVVDGGSITAVTPGGTAGTVDVTVTANGQTSQTSPADGYTYFDPPTLSGVSPPNGPAASGQSVTITGANLTGTTSVSFGGTPAGSFGVIDPTTIAATTPAHAGGTVGLTVTTPGGTSNAVPYTFMFPTTTALASSADPSIVGQPVTFTATVSPVPDGGSVAFADGGSTIAGCASQPVDTTTGTATCTVAYSAVGNHSLTAAYSGDFDYGGSTTSAALVQQVAYAVKALYNQAKDTHSGATVPVKIELDDWSGTNVSSSSIVVTVAGLSPSPAPGVAPSGTFTFMVLGTGPGYQLNVRTTDYPNGAYTLSFTATGDPVTHSVGFVVG